MGYRDYSTAKGHIVDPNGFGDFTTITAAINAAVSGQTIFLRPGTYTENPTLKAGVNLAAFDADATTPNVIINGKCSFSSAGTVSISGIELQTNSDFCLAVSGSVASIVNLNGCVINALNNTAISYTSSSASSIITCFDCIANIGTTGIAIFNCNTAGTFTILYCNFTNSANSNVANNFIGTGFLNPEYSQFNNPITIGGSVNCSGQGINVNTAPTNTTSIITTSSGSWVSHGFLGVQSGSASAILIGSGSTLSADILNVTSSNTNALTGLGTLTFGLITYSASSGNNVSTQTALTTQPKIAGGTVTQHDILIGGSGGQIASVAPSATSGVPVISQGAAADPVFGTAVVAGGGTGNTSATAYAVLCGGTTTTGAFQSIASVGTTGQVLTSNGAGALPTFQAASSGAMTLLQTQTASNSASISFSSTFITATYNKYMVLLSNVVPVTNGVSLEMNVSTNNGSTYLNTGYNTQATIITQGGVGTSTSTTTSLMTNASNTISNSAGLGVNANILLQNLTSGSGQSNALWNMIYNISSFQVAQGGGTLQNNAVINNIQFIMSSGNISTGTFSLYGISS